MKKTGILTILVCLLVVVNIASADTFGSGANQFSIDFVNIGNAGNAADTTSHGAVGYNYRIGKYEITNAQWNAFTAAAGATTGNPGIAYDENAVWADVQQPTDSVSWYETLQFCNYLTSGDKSKGAYLFSGNNTGPGDFLGIDRVAAQAAYGTVYFLPTTDEWYKAAYYKSDGSGYSLYANGTNTAPIVGDDTNYHWAIGSPWNVGTGTMEQNGTFDMMGNVWEWTETLISPGLRDLRGNSYSYSSTLEEDQYNLSSSFTWPGYYEYTDNLDMGFRIASVPEPATLLLLGLGGFVLRRGRK